MKWSCAPAECSECFARKILRSAGLACQSKTSEGILLPPNHYSRKDIFMPQAIMETSKGTINLELFDKDAPGTVKNFVTLAKKGLYDGLNFHRVTKDFM